MLFGAACRTGTRFPLTPLTFSMIGLFERERREKMKEYQLFIDNEYTASASGEYSDDINPATGEVYARIQNAGKEDVERILTSSAKAFETWKALNPTAREKLLLNAAVHINGPSVRDEPVIPFGGVKDSGFGREGGPLLLRRDDRVEVDNHADRAEQIPVLGSG
jgi:delta 1-pyrroline-5-carboxylate dehydrogenase